jgi:hypothetical protein
MHTKFWSESFNRRDNLGSAGTDGKIILKRILTEMECKDVDRIDLAQNMFQWRVS